MICGAERRGRGLPSAGPFFLSPSPAAPPGEHWGRPASLYPLPSDNHSLAGAEVSSADSRPFAIGDEDDDGITQRSWRFLQADRLMELLSMSLMALSNAERWVVDAGKGDEDGLG